MNKALESVLRDLANGGKMNYSCLGGSDRVITAFAEAVLAMDGCCGCLTCSDGDGGIEQTLATALGISDDADGGGK